MSQRRLTLSGWCVLVCAALTVALAGCPTLQAAEASTVSWHSDVESAWQSTQNGGRPLLIFVTAQNCLYCTKMKDSTYADPCLAARINRSFVPLVLDGRSSSPLLKELGVTGFPTTFVVSRDAVILDRVNGYVSPEALAGRLAAIEQASTAK